MKLKIPTWLMFLFLGIASFAPLVRLRPGRWMPYYYGTLLICWVLVSVAATRRVAREDRKAKPKLARMLRQLRDAKKGEAAETDADAVRHALTEERLIIVARDEVVLYDHIRRDQFVKQDRQGYYRPPPGGPSASNGQVCCRPPPW